MTGSSQKKTGSIEVTPLGQTLGAEIRGVDLSQPIGTATLAEIELAFANWSVIVFRDQTIAPEDQLRFAGYFGDLEINSFDRYGLEGYPGVLKVTNIRKDGKPYGYADAGSFWHSDMSYTPTPPRLTMLYAIEVPRNTDGTPKGDTRFANAIAAYDTLPAKMRAHADGLRAVHDFSAKKRGVKKAVVLAPEQIAANPPVTHPGVRTHPVTGKKAIYVTRDECTRIEGMADTAARELIDALAAHVIKPEHQYHHKWQPGDLLMWDNCAVQHVVHRDYEWPADRRLMHRVTVNGSIPF